MQVNLERKEFDAIIARIEIELYFLLGRPQSTVLENST